MGVIFLINFCKNLKFLANRREDADRLLAKYCGKIPIILQKYKTSDIPEISKFKYLMPSEMTISQVINVIRKYIKSEEVPIS